MKESITIWVDLFAGAGGVSHGIVKSGAGKVAVAINHDPVAIASHAANHPETVHLVEDIRTVSKADIKKEIDTYKNKHDVLLCIWASPDCTHFSKAKGGGAKDRDTRSLPKSLYRYVKVLRPDYLFVENVEEFMSWGELDEKGRPISRKNGLEYLRWKDTISGYGYQYDHRIMNAADYGAYTKRRRYIGQFARHGLKVSWPVPTHTVGGSAKCMFSNGMAPWRPVREVLDLEDEGKSIFGRKKPLVEKTLARIYAGLVKYVGNDSTFLIRYNGTSTCESVGVPASTLDKNDRLGKITAHYLDKSYSGSDNHASIDAPAGTLMKNDKHALVSARFIDRNFSQGGKHQSVEVPAGSLLKTPKMNLVTAVPFIFNHNYANKPSSVEDTSPTLLASRKHYYLVNPQYASKGGSIDDPCFTLIARMDKAPPHLVTCVEGKMVIMVYESDSPMTRKIKEFMTEHGIVDVKMRMLKVSELKRIQGFDDDYVLKGSQTKQKAFIGNSVPPDLVAAIAANIELMKTPCHGDILLEIVNR